MIGITLLSLIPNLIFIRRQNLRPTK
jgi:hypothetical protein